MSQERTASEAIWQTILFLKHGPAYENMQNVPKSRHSEMLIKERARDWMQVVQGRCDLELIKARQRSST